MFFEALAPLADNTALDAQLERNLSEVYPFGQKQDDSRALHKGKAARVGASDYQ